MLKGRPRVITQLIYNFRRNLQASILMMSALLMPVIVGMAGLGLDASNWMMTQRMLQNSVDAAVLAAAWETAHGMSDNMQDAAEREAGNNGWDKNKDGTLTLTVDTNSDGEVEVTGVLQQKADVYLSRMIHGSDIYIATKAGATLIGPSGDFCVLALSNAASGAITFQGSSDIQSSGCGLAINSNSSTALDHNGGAYDASFNDVTIVGSASSGMTCGNGNLSCNSLQTNSGSTPDPYSNLEVPTHSTTANADPSVGNNQTVTIDPGTYNGLSVHNGTLNLNPGVYYIQDSDLSLNGGTITGNGVTIILTSSDGTNYANIDVRGNANLNLTPPTDGDTAGVAIFVDRNAPTAAAGSGNSCENKLNGTAALNIIGAIYIPSQCLVYTGNNSSSSGNACTRIIADSVVFSGNSGLGNNCSGTQVKDIGQYTVKLSL